MKQVVSDDSSPTSEHLAPNIIESGGVPTDALPHASPPAPLLGPPRNALLSQAPTSDSPASRDSDRRNDSGHQSGDARSGDAIPDAATDAVVTGDIERDPTVISRRPVAAPADFTRSLSLIELARSLEGRQLHHFAVGRMIGGGGMGAVFRGRDLRLDREVAIKVIPESRRDPETLRRFRMEAQSAARLDHPNIARVYDIGEDEAWNYIVFEFIDGINLRDLVQVEGPMTIDDAVFTTRQVAEALQHAHDRDVVHRDIKPSNVIITPTGIAKVVDMGLARNTAMDRSTADQTASGVTLGTFDYISPEQARDPRDADVRSDLYSLGCTLFYMLTGQPPFPDGTALQKLLNHGSQPPPDPRQWRDDISDQLYAVLAKLMAKRPADRYQKPLELINDLLLVAQLEGLPRSRSPGSILMRATIAQRTLMETHLPWLVPMSVLLISAFWLQSADSLTSSLDLAPGSMLSTPISSPRGLTEDVLPGVSALAPSPATSDHSPIIEPPSRTEPLEEGIAPLEAGILVPGPPGPGSTLAGSQPRPVVPLASQSTQTLDVTTGGASASAALAMSEIRSRMSSSPGAGRDSASANSVAGAVENAGQSKTPDLVSRSDGPMVPPAAAATGSTATNSQDAGRESIEGSVEPRLPSPSARDTIVVSATEPTEMSSSALWSTSLSEALVRASMVPEVRVIELRDSIELNRALAIPRSGLTLRAPPGKAVEIVLDGEQAYGMGWESWIEVRRVAFRCERIHFTCRNNMRQAQAIFAIRSGGQLELVECVATMASNQGAPLGSCVLVSEPELPRGAAMPSAVSTTANNDAPTIAGLSPGSTSASSSRPADMPALSESSASPGGLAGTTSGSVPAGVGGNLTGTSLTAGNGAGASASAPGAGLAGGSSSVSNLSAAGEPIAIALTGCLIRGNQNLVSMRTACRAEINVVKTCAILEGRALTIRGLEQDRMPPVVRWNMELSTVVCRQGFASVQTSFSLRAPLTLMRTAKLCAFWSPSMVPHITVDGIADQAALDELLQLRGEENAYDQNIETLCQCRFADGKHIDFSFRDATGEWFRERGNDNSLRWQNTVPPDRPLEDQRPEDYRLRAGMFVPGLPPSAPMPPPVAGASGD